MYLWLQFARIETRNPEYAIFDDKDTRIAENAFRNARQHGMRGALSLLVDVNLRRQEKNLPLIPVSVLQPL